jgi:hypothetical protein
MSDSAMGGLGRRLRRTRRDTLQRVLHQLDASWPKNVEPRVARKGHWVTGNSGGQGERTLSEYRPAVNGGSDAVNRDPDFLRTGIKLPEDRWRAAELRQLAAVQVQCRNAREQKYVWWQNVSAVDNQNVRV